MRPNTNQRVSSICRHACIKTRLLLGVAYNKEFKTKRISSVGVPKYNE